MHPITAKENRLFRKRKNKQFFKDGLPSPKNYLASKHRTLLLFRQANAQNKRGDLRNLKSVEGNLRFWKRVSSWCYALAKTTPVTMPARSLWKDWDRKKRKGELAFIKSTLRPFGFINLDKVGGGGCSSKARMKEVARNEGKLLREQLEIYKPDVIIICGLGELFDLLRGILIQGDKTELKQVGKRRFQEVSLSGRSVCLIESYHPAQRRSTYACFSEVVHGFRHVAKKYLRWRK